MHFLPSLEYVTLLGMHNRVLFDVHRPYVKQTYRNRAVFPAKEGPFTLIVPVQHPTQRPFYEMLISYRTPWHRHAIRSLQTLYGTAPYFEYFFPDYQRVLEKKKEHLVDLNRELLVVLLKHVGFEALSTTLTRTPVEASAQHWDRRDTITPKVHKKMGGCVHTTDGSRRYFSGADGGPPAYGGGVFARNDRAPLSSESALHTLFHLGPSVFVDRYFHQE